MLKNDPLLIDEDSSQELYCFEDLSERDFAEIKKIAGKIYDEGEFGGNQFKCAIAAFNIWVRRMLGKDGEERTLH